MGWADCGVDSDGRHIGYAFEATCDEPGCDVEIDRGLSYACGGMHGEDVIGCEKYFCSEHLGVVEIKGEPRAYYVCQECEGLLRDDNQLVDN